MQIKFDYRKDEFTVDEQPYPLAGLRKHLINNHEDLVSGHFIKAIHSAGRTKFTFDWDAIYFKAKEYSIIKNYIHDLQGNCK